MGTQIRLILATICLTVLIWVYADLASQENRDIKLRIELSVPPQSDAVVHIRGAAPEKPGIKDVSIKLGGPKAAIARLDDEERSQGLLLKLPVQIEGAKTREISLRNAVHDWAISRGLHLISLDLDVLWYKVDQYVEIELTVEPDAAIFVSEMRGPPSV